MHSKKNIYIYKYYIYNLPRLHFKSQFVSSQVARCQIWHQWSERLWWQRPRRPAERYRVNSSVLECVGMCSNSFQHSCNWMITSRVIFNLQSTWFDLSPYPNLLRRNTSRLSHTFAEHLSACNACALGWFHCKRCKRHHKYLRRRDIQDKKRMSLCLVENHLNQRRPFAFCRPWRMKSICNIQICFGFWSILVQSFGNSETAVCKTPQTLQNIV